jgi:hypothetical protein
LNLCSIVVAILKMATGRNFSMSGYHNLPTYEMSLKSNIVEFVQYCGGHFPDIEKFLPVAIFKMTATIPHKFNIVRYHQNLICG